MKLKRKLLVFMTFLCDSEFITGILSYMLLYSSNNFKNEEI